MDGRSRTVFVCMALFAACMLHTSLAQTSHVVGDGLGWTVPPGGDVAYQTWAASQTFTVGDILVFNYMVNAHDVAEVSREEYDSCNSTNPISMYTSGPTSVNLTAPGEHYFICTISGHCSSGQRLAISVSSTVSPAPSPQPPTTTPEMAPPPVMTTTPSPSAAPAPTPSRGPMTHIVGDSLGWTVAPGGPIAYRNWTMNRTFMVGDILVFNFSTGEHDVVEVTSAEIDSCNITSTANIIMNGPANITLTSPGEHYYTCTIGQHCSFGQQLAINVTGDGSMTPTGGMQPPSSTTPSIVPPPFDNSASPLAAVAAPLTLLAIAVAFFV